MTQIIVNDSQLRALLKRLGQEMGSSKLLEAIGLRVLKWIDDNFRRGGIEQKWAPLAPLTVYARRQGSDRPLQDTGHLKSASTFSVRGDAVHIGWPGGPGARLADIHHAGTHGYVIRAKRRALAIPTPSGNVSVEFPPPKSKRLRAVMRPQVEHPGIPARPLLPSERAAGELAQNMVVAILRQRAGG